jgi:hypothetical protein
MNYNIIGIFKIKEKFSRKFTRNSDKFLENVNLTEPLRGWL